MSRTPDLLTPPTMRPPMNPVLKLVLKLILAVGIFLVGGYLILLALICYAMSTMERYYHACTPEVQRHLEEKLETAFPESIQWENFYCKEEKDCMEGVFTIPRADLYAMFPEDRFVWQSASAEEISYLYNRAHEFKNAFPTGFQPPEKFRIIPDTPGVAQFLGVIAEFPDDETAPVRVWMMWFTT